MKLASLIASSSVENLCTVTIGPNISSGVENLFIKYSKEVELENANFNCLTVESDGVSYSKHPQCLFVIT